MKTSDYEDREQSEVKHKLLERYLHAAVPIIGSFADDITYVDCLAGPWNSKSETYRDTSFGRALAALSEAKRLLNRRERYPTMRALLVEQDPSAYAQLEPFAQGVTDVQVTPKRWDFGLHVSDIVKFVRERPNCFPFIFIDPKGYNLAAIPLIRPLLQLERGEVVINLMTSWIARFLSDHSKDFRPLLGEHVQRLCDLKGDDREEELVRTYAGLVKKAGSYKYVCFMPVMKSDQDAFHFYLVYATRHPKGVEEFKKAEKAVIPFMHETRAEAQRRRESKNNPNQWLLPPEETYKQRRFSDFQERSLVAAKRNVLTMIESQESVFYDEVWSEFMQHSGVTENDLRDYLDELETAKRISIHRANLKKKLCREDHVRIFWKG